MPLQEDLDTLMAAITSRSQSLIANATPKDLVILAKSAEAMRGTVALQAILQASDTAQGAISSNRVAALAALAAALSSSEGALDDKETDILASLEAVKTTYLADMLVVLNASGNYRVGDMWIGMFPDPNNLPTNVYLLDGSTKSASLCPGLVQAWGLGAGQTPVPFVTNYNASNPYGITVAVNAGVLRLPNMAGGFMRGRTSGDVGLFQADELKSHGHTVANSQLLTKQNSGAAGAGMAVGANFSPVAAVGAIGDTGGAETRPANYAGLWVVRKS
jgi:hypothetical protein